MKEKLISDIINIKTNQDCVVVKGWVRTKRESKNNFCFIEVNDGSTLSNLQIIADEKLNNYKSEITRLTTGSSITVHGKLVESLGREQKYELQADKVIVHNFCPNDYPLQKKRHSFDYLRSIAHLRPRTNTFGAITRIRNTMAFETHSFFQQKKFIYLNTPIITTSDCEGAGQMFRVTTFDSENNKQSDCSSEFFNKPAFLTVSGQLEAEVYACAMGRVYTFGPTFRAENSNTSRHLAEFWMVEPEAAFLDINGDMELAESYLKHIILSVLNTNLNDLELFNNFIDKNVIKRLENIANYSFEHITYTKAVEILKEQNQNFEYKMEWGKDLQSEHEKYLTEIYFKSPVIVTDYPKNIKAFYMKQNSDNSTVRAMDVLVPKIGEIIGGSQREDDFEILKEKMIALNLNPDNYKWYLDLRKYGSVPHAGFGLGFERAVLLVTGMENIRDVIPFPRTPGNAEF